MREDARRSPAGDRDGAGDASPLGGDSAVTGSAAVGMEFPEERDCRASAAVG